MSAVWAVLAAAEEARPSDTGGLRPIEVVIVVGLMALALFGLLNDED